MTRRAKVIDLPLVPGARSDDTDLAAKLQAVSMDKVRSRGNRWETIRGWSAFNASGMSAGTARGIYSYSDLDGNPIVVAASESAVNAWVDGSRITITPKWKDVWLDATGDGGGTGGGNRAATSNGSDGTVRITWYVYNPATNTSAEADHNLIVGDSVTFSGVVQESGDDITLNGTFTITEVPSPSTFIVDTGTGSTLNVELPFVCTVAFRNGLATGTGNAIEDRARIISFDNFGENAVFCGSDGTPVWYWQPAATAPELIDDGDFSSTDRISAGAGWSVAGGTATHSGTSQGDLTFDVDGILEAGKTYEMSFDVTVWESNVAVFEVKVGGVNIFPPVSSDLTATAVANMDRTYTFRFVCPPTPTSLVFTANSDNAASDEVTIDNVSVKQLLIAHPINEAPQKNYALFVDGNRILNVLGSVEADGDFSPTLLRWSDMDNYREWVPDTDNVAGEFNLGDGSYAVCGVAVGERNLISTDDAIYSATFTGNGYSIQQIAQGCGVVGPLAIGVHDNRAFWASNHGFHAYDGAQVLAIECPIKDRYVGKLAQYQENKTCAWINNEFGEVWIHYAHTDDGTETSRYLIYNFVEQSNPWSFGTLNRTCMTRARAYTYPIGIDSSDNIWKHETGSVFSGAGITLPFIETGYITADAGDRWMGCRRYYPDVENQTGNILFTVTGKRAPQGQLTTQTIGPLTILPDQRTVDFLMAARQLKFRWESATSTTKWRLGVVGLEVVSERERR